MQAEEPLDYLRRLGEAGDGPHDIARAALMLAALDHPGKPLITYTTHLEEISDGASRAANIGMRTEDAVHILSMILAGHGYDGDRLNYDDPRNADLIGVIERRRGLPVALGILYMHAARAAGFLAFGLSAPGHFLLRIAGAGREVIWDPFNGTVLARHKLGSPPGMPAAEEANVFEPVSDTDVLLRLQNNLKLRASESGNHVRAVEIAGRMVTIAPKRAELWLEVARLNDAAGGLRSGAMGG